ncbi:ribulokinase [Gracilibacillus phocaeensis]|uniref:ribulokinase n=1 Tax=Gracilibacillus phocaeensis TaxID=2042304 RepID=UPI0010309331|nr:ribulokinase [Gracilibacillus phocaeensis]
MTKYVIGIDYGTESARAVLVSLEEGVKIAQHEMTYSHGVLDDKLPNSNTMLGQDWALEHPNDYLEVLERSIPAILNQSQIDSKDIIGIGIDFTSCTILPVDNDGNPLMYKKEWYDDPHAWVKLWKHHAAQNKANIMNKVAEQRNEKFLYRYGGKISSEWMLPKIWQVMDESPNLYKATDKFVEAMDWIIFKMTGNWARSISAMGYKAIWNSRDGFPTKEYLRELSPDLQDVIETKLRGDIVSLGQKVGEIDESIANKTGLQKGTAVAVGNIDAHAAVVGMGVVEPGKLVMVMGTSLCHMLISPKNESIEGISGVVKDGIIPGYYGYEAGQPAVGDMFSWYVNHVAPTDTKEAAAKEGINIHQWFIDKASNFQPGETGLLALDWWNGNRSLLIDSELSGLLIGMTLQTKPEEIYRALLESAAFGTKKIIEAFQDKGIPVKELYACGGLAQKNPLLMQIYADVTNRIIRVADSTQTSAVGAAMFGAVAAGVARGGITSIEEVADKVAKLKEEVYTPNPQHVRVYEKLYQEYLIIYNYFGRGENDVMKHLKNLKYNKTKIR